MSSKLAVIGQGYVGLPLAIRAAEQGIPTVGIDLNHEWIERISRVDQGIEQVNRTSLETVLKNGKYQPSIDFSQVAGCEVVAICVPTPLNSQKEPDLSFLESAISSFAPFLSPQTLIILESTSYPGTMREIVIPQILKKASVPSEELFFAFSPERIDPANASWNVYNTPKIVSGLDANSLERAVQFYSQFMESIVPVPSLEVAETAKLLENTFRQINISFINEFAQLCEKIGVSVWDVIDAAATKPFGFTKFSPSIGIGGHCIPVDPLYLNWKLKEMGESSRFIELAEEVNESMPTYVAERALALAKKGAGTTRCLVVGITYKPNVSDLRESAALRLITELRGKGAEVLWHDPYIAQWNGELSSPITTEADVVIVATGHSGMDLSAHLAANRPILDCTGRYRTHPGVTSL